jgi:carbon monoxide dehydrogenase subunit G
MATIRHQIDIAVPAACVWDAARDIAALHTRLVPGFVTATEMLPGTAVPTRRVSFASGAVLDEKIVAIDDDRRRLVWSIQGVEHHNGALEIIEAGCGARVVWTADVLPAELAERFSPLMAEALGIMKKTLEAGGAASA